MKRSETIYGMHAVRVMLERHAQRVLNVRLAEQRGDARVREIEELAHRAERPVQRVDMHSLRQELGDVAHQGVAAEITPIPPWGEDELLEALQSARAPVLLALDGVQDPQNLGACLRSADACGALAVIVPRDRAAQVTPAVRKVAAGAAETTPVVAVTNLVRTLKLLKDAGLWIIGADDPGARCGSHRTGGPRAWRRRIGTSPPDAAELRFPREPAAAGGGRESQRLGRRGDVAL